MMESVKKSSVWVKDFWVVSQTFDDKPEPLRSDGIVTKFNHESERFLKASYMPGTMPSTLLVLPHLINSTTYEGHSIILISLL